MPEELVKGTANLVNGFKGGHKSPNWYSAHTGPGIINQQRRGYAGYKDYLLDLLRYVYLDAGDAKYFEPVRLRFELALKYGRHPEYGAEYNLQKALELLEFGRRGYKPGDRNSKVESTKNERELVKKARGGSEEWVALQVGPPDACPTA